MATTKTKEATTADSTAAPSPKKSGKKSGTVKVKARPVRTRGFYCAGKFWPYVPAGAEAVAQDVDAELVERVKNDPGLTDVEVAD